MGILCEIWLCEGEFDFLEYLESANVEEASILSLGGMKAPELPMPLLPILAGLYG